MGLTLWVACLPPLLTIAFAIWSKKIIPSLFIGLLVGSFMLRKTFIGGFETTLSEIINTISDKNNLQVLLFLYLFSGLIAIIKKSGGIMAFSGIVEKRIKSKKGVLLTVWALIPVTFIDCGFRVIGAGSIIRSLAEKKSIANERLAFMLNNSASPVVELIPIATTFIGFNVANISLGLQSAGVANNDSAYSIWLKAIPFEFFSIVIIAITFLSIFFKFKKPDTNENMESAADDVMKMNMEDEKPAIAPRAINIILPLLSVVSLSIVFFWFFGKDKSSFLSAINDSQPNKAMLIALLISLIISAILYLFQKYDLRRMTKDIIAGGNSIITTLIILILAWSLAAVAQELGLSSLIKQQLGSALPSWCIPVFLFILSSAITYFIGSGWGAASLIMPFAIPLAVSSGSYIPLCVAAVITGGTFGDVTSPLAGMTNMSANVAHADHGKYIAYANPYNFAAAGISAVLFLIAGLLA